MVVPDPKETQDVPPEPSPRETLTGGLGTGEVAAELARVLEEYMDAVRAGRAPERQEVLNAYPSLAERLEGCLTAIDFIHGASGRAESHAPVQLGDFRILREVGRGGMGVVYEAEQVSLKRRVALKVLRFGAVADSEAMRRFEREAQTVAGLHHTNIVPIFAIGCDQGVHYYAMQFIEGRSLAELAGEQRDAEPSITPEDVARWGLQAAEALAHAHERGVIHRDIKPSNLILDPDGRIWLTDFGLAKRLDDVTLSVTGTLLGTPRYMSPEQARATKSPVDHRTDIYSLGATLYELATGRPLFVAESAQGIISQILNTEPTPPRRIRPALPRALETIIMRCLEKEPAKRYGTARELAEDQRAFLDGRPIRARRPGAVEQAVRWARKRRRSLTAAALSALASVIIVLGVITGLFLYRQSQVGLVSLKCTGRPLLAEVIDENGDRVVPPITVPTSDAVPLRAGSYHLRLSGAGSLSETWPLEIERRREERYTVGLHPQRLWPPVELRAGEFPAVEILQLGGQADLALILHAPVGYKGGHEGKVRRLDGATGEPVWRSDLVFNAGSLPAGQSEREWSTVMLPSPVDLTKSDRGFLHPPPDLDGDGTGDLVRSSRTSPSLLAISASDGTVLWWFRGRPRAPKGVDESTLRPQRSRGGCVIGQVVTVDADGDGTPDVVACFASRGEDFISPSGKTTRAEAESWVEAVSGRSGASLWRYSMGNRAFTVPDDSETARRQGLTCRPRVVLLGARPTVVLLAGTTLLGLDASTGEEAWPPHDLGFRPLRAPEVVDLDGDGSPEALLLRPDSDSGGALSWVAVSLKDRTTSWEASFRPFYDGGRASKTERAWILVTDLEGDGKLEIIIPTGWFADSPTPRWAGLEVLEGGTGGSRWHRRLWFTGHAVPPPIDRFVIGPDLDGDGARELFVAWLGEGTSEPLSLRVAALAGRDGRILWQSRQDVSGQDIGPLLWWHAGLDGSPQLVVPVEGSWGEIDKTFILSAGTGRLAHIIPEVFDPRVADFNGDGLSDLLLTTHTPQGSLALFVLQGMPPAAWRRLGVWHPVEDLDGDGFDDLMHESPRSGRDGRRLWGARPDLRRTDGTQGTASRVNSPPLPRGDLDGDGTPDLLGFVHGFRRTPAGTGVGFQTAAAFSGRDGHRLWTTDDLGIRGSASAISRSGSYDYPSLDCADLDGDGRGEVFVAHGGREHRARLSVLSGTSGKLQWEVLFVAGSFCLRPSPGRPALEDLNGDGTRDLVLWVPGDGPEGRRGPWEVRAVSGRDGTGMWPSAPVVADSWDEMIWLRPAAGDLDGDGIPEVVVTVRRERKPREYRGEVLVLDGRDGRQRWAWSWAMPGIDIWPPLLVDLDGTGRRGISIGVEENGVQEIVILGAEGQIRRRIHIGLTRRFEDGVHLWGACDLDGDGAEELIFPNENRLCAGRADDEGLLWAWPLPAERAKIVEIRPAAGRVPATVVVWAGRTVCGLAGPTGKPRWRCEVPEQPQWGRSDPPAVSLLSAGDPAVPPRVLFHHPSHGSYGWATVCRQAWPAEPTGEYRPPARAPMDYEPLPEPTPPPRPLPWARDFDSWNETGTLRVVILPWLSLAVVIIPYLWIASAVRRRLRNQGLLASLYTVVALALYIYYASTAGRPANLDGIPVIFQAVLGMPSAVFFTLAALWSVRRQWRRVGLLVGLSLAVAVVNAAVAIWGDRAWMAPSEGYSLRGWYWVWFQGAYLSGAFVLLALIGRWVVQGVSRGTRALVTHARSA